MPSAAVAALLSPQSANLKPAPFPLAASLIHAGAKNRQSPGLAAEGITPRSNQRQVVRAEPWLALALRSRWESYRERLEECRDAPSEESVHQLRVAIRRLTSQVILLDCVFPETKSQRTLRTLKRQLKSLGQLRDHHVQQVLLEGQAARFPELLVLRSYFRRREGTLIKTASRQISRFRAKKLGKWIRAHIEELTQYSGDARRQNQLVALAVRRAGETFAETVARQRAIDFSDLSTIHRTRVAFKKFRYIVESIPLGVAGLSKRDLRALALYQRRMGVIQDLEVIQESITDLIQRQGGLEGLLADFCAYLRRRRTRALLSFRKSADKLFQFWPPRPTTKRPVPAPTSDAAIQKA